MGTSTACRQRASNRTPATMLRGSPRMLLPHGSVVYSAGLSCRLTTFAVKLAIFIAQIPPWVPSRSPGQHIALSGTSIDCPSIKRCCQGSGAPRSPSKQLQCEDYSLCCLILFPSLWSFPCTSTALLPISETASQDPNEPTCPLHVTGLMCALEPTGGRQP